MSIDQTATTERRITVPDSTDGTHIATEYGCRYPDGRQEWGSFSDYSGVAWYYASIIVESSEAYNTRAVEQWGKTLRKRAEAARIDPAEYAEGHTFLKRTVILVTTKAEEVA